MADESDESNSDGNGESDSEDGEEKSFRERVEEIRQQRAEQEGDEEGEVRSPADEMMGGNPFAQMMGGMMGGGPPGMGGGPPGMGGPPGAPGAHGREESGETDEELIREVRKLRDEVHDVRRTLDRIADALEE